MIIRSQDGTKLIQCKNFIVEQTEYSNIPSYRISDISRKDRDFTLGYYNGKLRTMGVMAEIQEILKNESRLIINKDGNIEQTKGETVYQMPQREAEV